MISGKPRKAENLDLPDYIYVDGLPRTFSDSQRIAVQKALKERLTLIQGPPGTGKTVVVSAIVANWAKKIDQKKILICTPSNPAADLIAERL